MSVRESFSARHAVRRSRSRDAAIRPRPLSSLYSVAFVAGVLGAVAMSVLRALGLSMTTSLYGLEMLLGSFATRNFSPGTMAIGFAWHLLNGGLFALLYAACFTYTRRSGARAGAVLGIGHWIVAIFLINGLRALHPMADTLFVQHSLGPASHAGASTYLSSLVLHLVYGATVGAVYNAALRRRPAQVYGGELEPAPRRRHAA